MFLIIILIKFTPLKLSDEQLSTQKTFQSLGISTSCKVSYIGN